MNFEIKVNDTLSLKLRHVEDAEALYALVDVNRDHLRPWFPWVDTTLSADDSKKFIEKCQEDFAQKKAADFGVWYEGKCVGSMGFHTIRQNHQWAEIGYWLSKDSTGKGVMTECVKAMINYGFNDLGLHRIQIKCDADNLKSKAIPERLGFILEGTRRECRKNEDGSFSDEFIYGILRTEWKG